MQTQAERRIKKRVPCRFSVGGARHSGMVLNVSRRGLFLQTSVGARPGDDIELALSPPNDAGGIPLRARVVWNRSVSSRLRSVTTGGLGLRIENAPETWYRFLAGLRPGDSGPIGATAAGAGSGSARTPAAVAGLPLRFRVRVKQSGGPRTRVVVVEARSQNDACGRALAQVGSGWSILEAEPVTQPG